MKPQMKIADALIIIMGEDDTAYVCRPFCLYSRLADFVGADYRERKKLLLLFDIDKRLSLVKRLYKKDIAEVARVGKEFPSVRDLCDKGEFDEILNMLSAVLINGRALQMPPETRGGERGFERGLGRGFDNGFDGGFDNGFDGGFERDLGRGFGGGFFGRSRTEAGDPSTVQSRLMKLNVSRLRVYCKVHFHTECTTMSKTELVQFIMNGGSVTNGVNINGNVNISGGSVTNSVNINGGSVTNGVNISGGSVTNGVNINGGSGTQPSAPQTASPQTASPQGVAQYPPYRVYGLGFRDILPWAGVALGVAILIAGVICLAVFASRIQWAQWQHIIGSVGGLLVCGAGFLIALFGGWILDKVSLIISNVCYILARLAVIAVVAVANFVLAFVFGELYYIIFCWLSGYLFAASVIGLTEGFYELSTGTGIFGIVDGAVIAVMLVTQVLIWVL